MRAQTAALEQLWPRRITIMTVVAAAIALRVWVSTFGHNFDFASYQIVAELQAAGENVYANTPRYNYGPPWFLLLGSFWRIASLTSFPVGVFRAEIIALLTLVDLALAGILYRRYGATAGLIMLFSPIAIIITGYHNQFDNLAVLLGLVGVLIVGDRVAGRVEAHEWFGLALLALSLGVKHVLLAFPVWLAVRQTTWARRAVFVLLPGSIFLLSFGPWLGDGGLDGVLANVIKYRSFGNAPIVATFVGGRVSPGMLFNLGTALFVGALALGSFWTRRLPPPKAYLVYLVVVAVFAPAVANQYFAIPLAAVAAFPNALFFVWMAAATLFLIGDGDGLHLSAVLEVLPDLLRKDQISHSVYRTITWLLASGGALWWWRSRGGRQVAP